MTHRALPGLPADDTQACQIEIETSGVALAGIYLPNGNSGGDAGYEYKLAWMDRLAERVQAPPMPISTGASKFLATVAAN